MLKQMADLNYYELLEVHRHATARQIEQAYARARMIYDQNSIAIYSLLRQPELEALQQQITDAYKTLSVEQHRKKYDEFLAGQEENAPLTPQIGSWHEQAEPERPPPHSEMTIAKPQAIVPALQMSEKLAQPPSAISQFSGAKLRELREQRDLTIHDVANITNVSAQHFKNIEEENFPKLPVRVYLRGYLALYAKALGYEPTRIVNDYLARYEKAIDKPH